MGLDIFQVQDVVEQKSIFENNVNLVLDIMNKPGWMNPLKMYQQPQMMMQQPMAGAPGQLPQIPPQQYMTGQQM